MSRQDPVAPIPVTVVPAPAASSASSDLVKTVGQFVGAIGGVAGAIYLVGTVVLLVRLAWTRGMSGVEQVPQLPRDVLVSVGLEVILVPLGIGVGYAIFRTILRNPEEAPPTSSTPVHFWNRLALFVLIATPAVVAWIIAVLNGHASIAIVWECAIGIGIAGLACTLALLTVLSWQKLGDAYREEASKAHVGTDRGPDELAAKQWNSMGAVLIVSLLFAVATVPSWAFAAMSLPLGQALVCPKSGGPVGGYLVGEGSSRTNLALYRGHAIVSFPNDQVVRVLTGRRSDLTSCPPAPVDTAAAG